MMQACTSFTLPGLPAGPGVSAPPGAAVQLPVLHACRRRLICEARLAAASPGESSCMLDLSLAWCPDQAVQGAMLCMPFLLESCRSLQHKRQAHTPSASSPGTKHCDALLLQCSYRLVSIGQRPPVHPAMTSLASSVPDHLHPDATMVHMQDTAPAARYYWGYIWDGTGNRKTQPIRNPAYKSYMPEQQVRSSCAAAGPSSMAGSPPSC
jgi:hypothetical protein